MKEVRKAMEESKKIDYEKIRQEMQKAREQWQNQQGQIRNELEKARAEINENKVNLKNEVMKPREEVREAKDELQSYKILLTRMEEDGLINTKGDYSISYRKGELFINGKKQSQETTDKYKSFFKRDNVEIKKEKGNFSLNNADK